MHPFEKDPPSVPSSLSDHLDVQLKSGWRFDQQRRSFVSAEGKQVSLKGKLPTGTKILAVAPQLAARATAELSDDEKLLAGSLQVVLPKGKNRVAVGSALRDLDAVASVSEPPHIGLPRMM